MSQKVLTTASVDNYRVEVYIVKVDGYFNSMCFITLKKVFFCIVLIVV